MIAAPLADPVSGLIAPLSVKFDFFELSRRDIAHELERTRAYAES